MRLTLLLQGHSREIILALEGKQGHWEDRADNAEGLIVSLDKILKSAKIGVRSIRSIRVTCPGKTSLTSFRLAKTFQKALIIAISKA